MQAMQRRDVTRSLRIEDLLQYVVWACWESMDHDHQDTPGSLDS